MADGTPRAIGDLSPADMARSHLVSFQCGASRTYAPGLHHHVIGQALMEVEAGRIDRILIEAPPRHGKTRQVGVDFPCWALGRNPSWDIAYATYSAERASDVGIEVRGLFDSDYVRTLWPDRTINRRSNASRRFKLAQHRGSYQGVGVGGALTGRGAHLLILDDTVKDRVMADSARYQRRAREWFSAVASTRLEPGGRIVSMMTRWADADLHGHIQREHANDGWLVLRLPALAMAGDVLGRPYGAPLWPERWHREAMLRAQRGLLPRDWLALYQQSPSAGEGTEFRREWFRWYTPGHHPAKLLRYGAGDFAVTDAQRADFTELGIAGVDQFDDLWLLEGWTGQKTPDVWTESLLDLVGAHRPLAFYGESGVIRNAVEPGLIKRARERQVPLFCLWLPTIGDKLARARSFQARAATGRVWVPRNEWGRHVVDQLCAFPGGSHDDAVDMCGLWGRALDHLMAARADRNDESAGIQPFTAQWLEYQERTNATRIV
jgi:predicted phage terminase large subunit-like protein